METWRISEVEYGGDKERDRMHVPFSIPSYATSRIIRCWGSIAFASLGVMEKKGASKAAMSPSKK